MFGPNFILLPHALGRTRVEIQTHKSVLPAIQNIITDEKEFFRNIYSKLRDFETLKGIAEHEVVGMKVGLDVGVLRHQVKGIQEQPKIQDKIVIIVGSVLTILIIMMILVFYRE